MQHPQDSTNKTVDLFWELVYSVRQLAHPAKKGEATIQQFILLVSLHRYGEQRVGELARMVGLTQSSVSIAVKRLEKDGLVIRRRDPADERRVSLALTEAGRAVTRDWKAKRTLAVARFLQRLTADEQERLYFLLRKMLDPDNQSQEERH